MNRAPVMCNVHILVTVLVVTATMPHRLTAWKYHKKAELRVYQGVDDVTMKYPYVVKIEPIGCTGSLITPDWVLTAAHCYEDELSHIQYGNLSISLKKTKSKSKVIRTVSHPRYEPDVDCPNDIALLLVSPEVRMEKYGTLSAVDYTTLLGLSVEFVGFGMTYIEKRNTRNKWKRYERFLRQPVQIGQGVVSPCDDDEGFICVSPRCSIKQMILGGDSGGPLLVDNNIVGVATATTSEPEHVPDEHITAALFTPISPHQEWVHSVITSKSN